ncbi:MAG: benzoate/H(+) symporter BenE family transporter [Albidovulum sp.]
MRLSVFSAAFVAALVGYGSTITLVLAAAAALGATAAETASWVFAVCLAKAVGSAGLSAYSRVPVVLAWSTPGAALIAASQGLTMAEGVGAFVIAGLLILLTGLVKPLERLVSAIPAGIAAGMLAGVLLPFCLKVPPAAAAEPALILPVVAVFLAVRLWSPAFAVLAALATGLALAFAGGTALPALSLTPPHPVFIAPEWSMGALIGLALPLYLVTMASQNLPGFAVLSGAGYSPPVRPALTVTGGLSAISALFGAHTINMAAITAAICLGDDVHPDRAERWKVGLAYGFFWACLAVFGPLILAIFAVLPPALLAVVVGLALTAPLIGATAAAFAKPEERFAAATTLVTAASGVSAFGIGGAFWGLLAGLAVHGLSRATRLVA